MTSLPQYVRAWGGEVRPATNSEREAVQSELIVNIPIEKVFVLQKIGEDPRLVVRKRFCHKGKLRCSYPRGFFTLRKTPILNRNHAYQPRNNNRLHDISRVLSYDAIEGLPSSTRSPQNPSGPLKKTQALDKRKNAPDGGLSKQPNGRSSQEKHRFESGTTTGKGRISTVLNATSMVNDGNLIAKHQSPSLPYIWSEAYEELLGAVPLLRSAHKGISADFGNSPMIFVTNPLWRGELNGYNLRLETRRNISHATYGRKSLVSTSTAAFEPRLQDIHHSVAVEENDVDSDAELQYPNEPSYDEYTVPTQSVATRPWVPQFQDKSNSYGTLVPILPIPSALASDFREIPSCGNNSTPYSFTICAPEEIANLLRAHEGGMPVSVIAEADRIGFPYSVPLQCKYFVLGFFQIINVETDRDGHTNCLSERQSMSWSFTLRWLPGGPLEPGLPVDIDGRPHLTPTIPWWLSSGSESTTSMPPFSPKEFYEPIILGASIVAPTILHDAYEDRPGRMDASKRSWLCRQCRKLNSTNWIGKYICSFCGFTKTGLKRLFALSSVRDKDRFLPMWEPSMQLPKGVKKKVVLFRNRMKLFTFTLSHYEHTSQQWASSDNLSSLDFDSGSRAIGGSRKGKERAVPVEHLAVTRSAMTTSSVEMPLVVRLFFPGNHANLEKYADTLFIDFQKEVPMRFERSASKAMAGIYTFTTSPDIQNIPPPSEGFSNWDIAPTCVADARKLLVDYIRVYLCAEVDFSLQYFSAVAWLGESPIKKVIRVHAKENPTVLMCLGADVDIVLPKPGCERRMKSSSKSKSSPRRDLSNGKGHSDEHDQISKAGTNEEDWTNEAGEGLKKVALGSDQLRITLTHGSVVILSGGNVDLTVFRSNFAILLILSDGYGADGTCTYSTLRYDV